MDLDLDLLLNSYAIEKSDRVLLEIVARLHNEGLSLRNISYTINSYTPKTQRELIQDLIASLGTNRSFVPIFIDLWAKTDLTGVVGYPSTSRIKEIISEEHLLDHLIHNVSVDISSLPLLVDMLGKIYSLDDIKKILDEGKISIGLQLIWDCVQHYPLGRTSELLHSIDLEAKNRGWTTDAPTHIGIVGSYDPLYIKKGMSLERRYPEPVFRYYWSNCRIPDLVKADLHGSLPELFYEDWGHLGGPVLAIANIDYDYSQTRVHGRNHTLRIQVGFNKISSILDKLNELAIRAQRGELEASGPHIYEGTL